MLYYHKINGKKHIKKTEKLKANLAEIIETLIYNSRFDNSIVRLRFDRTKS